MKTATVIKTGAAAGKAAVQVAVATKAKQVSRMRNEHKLRKRVAKREAVKTLNQRRAERQAAKEDKRTAELAEAYLAAMRLAGVVTDAETNTDV